MNRLPLRDDHCKDCPFRKGIPMEAREVAIDGEITDMLCHESLSLDGVSALDIRCKADRVGSNSTLP